MGGEFIAMAKRTKGTAQYALKFGHPTVFRRTVTVGKGEPYQLVFEPGQLYELNDEEVACLDREIAAGILVEAAKDPKGRFRYLDRQANKVAADADATIVKLEKRIEDLAAENAKLQEQLKQGGGDKKDGSQNDKTSKADGE